MQYWIFFSPGVGGDGFCNLLEHADNVYPADNRYQWRIDPRVKLDSTVKFYCPFWFINHRFELGQPFRSPETYNKEWTLDPQYRRYFDLIQQGLNTVIPAHPEQYFDLIDKFLYKNIIEQNQHKILLYSLNFDRVLYDAATKNQKAIEAFKWVPESIEHELNSNKYDTYIDIEQVWQNWDYLDNILKFLNINLNKKFYDQYIKLVNPK
jgi:hypothetical protein